MGICLDGIVHYQLKGCLWWGAWEHHNDNEKILKDAIENILPHAEHRACKRHLEELQKELARRLLWENGVDCNYVIHSGWVQ